MTPEQITALHIKVIADPTSLALILARDTPGLKTYLNATASPDFFVWRSATPADEINDSIQWDRLTPKDVPDSLVLYTNRAMACSIRQMNLEIQLLGKNTVNTAKANIRKAFQDALTDVPSDVGGANRQAGWAAVKNIISRPATVAEKLSATGAGTAASPADLNYEGALSDSDASRISLNDDGSIWST
jgi:hypothetical protein